jgi:hypothetical protein
LHITNTPGQVQKALITTCSLPPAYQKTPSLMVKIHPVK